MSSTSNPPAEQAKQRPVETVRIGGIVAAIWTNETKDGRVLFNTTVERLYLDENGDWKSSSSFGRDDLLVLAKVCDRTHSRIHELTDEMRQQEKQASPEANGTSGAKAAKPRGASR